VTYERGDLLEKREMLMQAWANYCYPTGEKVIQMSMNIGASSPIHFTFAANMYMSTSYL